MPLIVGGEEEKGPNFGFVLNAVRILWEGKRICMVVTHFAECCMQCALCGVMCCMHMRSVQCAAGVVGQCECPFSCTTLNITTVFTRSVIYFFAAFFLGDFLGAFFFFARLNILLQ
jgi:hypothetical protein